MVSPNNAQMVWVLCVAGAIWKDGHQRMIHTTQALDNKYWDIHRSMGRIIAFLFKIRVVSTHVPPEFDGSLSAAPNSLCNRWHFLQFSRQHSSECIYLFTSSYWSTVGIEPTTLVLQVPFFTNWASQDPNLIHHGITYTYTESSDLQTSKG